MEKVTLVLENRQSNGSRQSKKLRSKGIIPVVMYGKGIETTNLQCKCDDLALVLNKGERLVNLSIQDKEELALIKFVQRNEIEDSILHLDFHRISMEEKVEVAVSLKFVVPSNCKAESALVQTPITELTVSCLPMQIPHEIVVNIGDMDMGDVRCAGDIVLPDGVELITEAGSTVVSVTEKVEREMTKEEGVEPVETQAPEIIKKGKADAEESEDK